MNYSKIANKKRLLCINPNRKIDKNERNKIKRITIRSKNSK